MKWLKHHTNARNNLDLKAILREFGTEGYGFYWICLELVGEQSENFRIKAKKNWKNELQDVSRIDQEKIETLLKKFAETGLIDKKALSRGDLYIPKMARYADEYTAKLRRVSGQPPDNIPLEEKRRDKKRREEKRPEASVSFLDNVPEQTLSELHEKYNASKEDIQGKANDLRNYCLAKGKVYKNYKAFLENALKKDYGLLTEKQKQERVRQAELQVAVANIHRSKSPPQAEGGKDISQVPGYKDFRKRITDKKL